MTDRRTLSKYEILGTIGQGGMGVVYKARDPLIDRVVAIKTIRTDAAENDRELLSRLAMEAKTAGRLQHPNIVTIYDFGHEGDLAYLVMEYVEGANLQRVIASGTPIPLMQRLDIVIQLADAIAYAHSLGVTHRDIKPANICLTRNGDPKILDFGLARIGETRLTRTGFTSGTAAYMSPERMSGESGPSDDVFALGAVAYEILTGQPAFPGETLSEVARNIMSGKYPVPPSAAADLPQELDSIIARATAMRKDARYGGAHELAAALRDLQQSATVRRRASSVPASRIGDLIDRDENPYTAADAAMPTAVAAHVDTLVGSDPLDTNAPTMAHERVTIEAPRPSEPLLERTAVAPRPVRNDAGLPTEAVDMSTGTMPTERIDAPFPGSASAAAPTEVAEAPASSFFDIPRTVVARVAKRFRSSERTESLAGPIGVVREVESDTSDVRAFAIAGVALFILLAAIPFTARASGASWVLVYAAAVGAWWFMVRAASPGSLKHVLLVAAAIHLPLAVQVPLVRAAGASWDGPVGALLAGGLAASGEPLVFGRILVLIATGAGIWMLWRGGRPRRALGFGTFPLLVIEGTLNARLEVVAAILLFAAAMLVRRNREGWSGLTAFAALGTFIPAVTLLPAIWDQAYHVAPFIGAALVVIIGVKLALPAESIWTGAFTGWILASPSLSAAAEWLAMRLTMWGAADFLDDLSLRAQERSGMTWSWRFDDEVIALIAVFVAVIMIATVAARRAKTPDATAADTLGATLLVSVALEPAMWLLVVPFAIASNRRIWILIALCAPILELARGGESIWIAWAVSLALPAAWWLAIRVGGPGAEEGQPVVA